MLGVGWEARTRVWSQACREPGMGAKRRHPRHSLLQGSRPSCAAHTLQVTCSWLPQASGDPLPHLHRAASLILAQISTILPRQGILSLEGEFEVVLFPPSSVLSWGKGVKHWSCSLSKSAAPGWVVLEAIKNQRLGHSSRKAFRWAGT